MTCSSCGAVQAQRMVDPGSEWRNFSDSDADRSRAQAQDDIMPELNTGVGQALFGAKPGHMFDGSGQKLGKMQARITVNQQERKIQNAFERIQHYSGLLRLTGDILQKSKLIYKEIEEKHGQKIRSLKKEPMVMAIIYIACKLLSASRTFRELSAAAGVDEKDIRKYYRTISTLLPEALRKKIQAEILPPEQLVVRLFSYLKFTVDVSEVAAKIAKSAVPLMEGKNPSSIAASAVYAAARMKHPNINQANLEKDIATHAHIAAGTVKNVYKEMLAFGEKIMPAELHTMFSSTSTAPSAAQTRTGFAAPAQ
jgi:transcription initiation factor TFIIIB Brf1 subunit/transcription initiation factor TFIIB